MERSNLRKLNKMEVRKQHQIEISERSAALENLSDSVDKNRAWEDIKVNIKISAKESLGLHELQQHKPWFDGDYLRFLENRKQSKMQWLLNPKQSNIHNLNNVRREASRHFEKKRRNI